MNLRIETITAIIIFLITSALLFFEAHAEKLHKMDKWDKRRRWTLFTIVHTVFGISAFSYSLDILKFNFWISLGVGVAMSLVTDYVIALIVEVIKNYKKVGKIDD